MLREHLTAEEKRQVVARLREALPGAEAWQRSYLAGLILDLDEDLDDDAWLALCREGGLIRDEVDRLVERGRLQEALDAIGRAEDHQVPDLADVLVAHGHGDRAEQLVRARMGEGGHSRGREWLRKRLRERNDFAGLLEMALEDVQPWPSLHAYRQVRDLARQTGQWEQVRPRLMRQFQGEPQREARIEIALEEGDPETALRELRAGKGRAVSTELAARVARAIEEGRPRDALELHRRNAEALIEYRHREAYRSACQVLLRVRDLYERLNDAGGWKAYGEQLRQKYRALRAFKEEWEAAGL